MTAENTISSEELAKDKYLLELIFNNYYEQERRFQTLESKISSMISFIGVIFTIQSTLFTSILVQLLSAQLFTKVILSLFLIVSFWEFDGNAIYAENNFFIILKMCMYFLIIPIELFILAKWIVPRCSHKTNNKFNSLKYIFGVPGVVLFRLILMNNQGNIDIPSLLRAVIFAFAVITLINSIYYFTQAFFAKKYSLDILTDYTESYINSIRRL